MGQIHELIPKITAEVKPVGKDHKNTQQNYKFRSIDDVYNVLNNLLGKYEVSIYPEYEVIKDEVQTTSKGSTQRSVLLKGIFKLVAPDESFEKTVTYGEAIDYGDKAFNKAMSAAYKYALFQTFCIPTEEAKDTETETPQIGKTDEQKNEEEMKKISSKLVDKNQIASLKAMLEKTKTDTDMYITYLQGRENLNFTGTKIEDMTFPIWRYAMTQLDKKFIEQSKTKETGF